MNERKMILVAEDESNIRDQLQLTLSDEYDLLMAEDGLEALTRYQRFRERVALVLTDCEMPVLNGIQLTIRLWRDDPDLPVIMTTGGGSRVEFEHFLQSPNFALIWKPFDTERLKDLIESLTEARVRAVT